MIQRALVPRSGHHPCTSPFHVPSMPHYTPCPTHAPLPHSNPSTAMVGVSFPLVQLAGTLLQRALRRFCDCLCRWIMCQCRSQLGLCHFSISSHVDPLEGKKVHLLKKVKNVTKLKRHKVVNIVQVLPNSSLSMGTNFCKQQLMGRGFTHQVITSVLFESQSHNLK